ncbi:MAG: hypothetical protein Q8Q59_09340 [Luteolibacter sp.]|jgi:hypothetical protein|nr:hypothetical protein [Luteolibacter sp.]
MDQLPVNLQKWLELADVENRKMSKRTWVPLMVSDSESTGRHQEPGFRKQVTSIESLIVPLAERDRFAEANWHSIQRNNPRAWADEGRFIAPHEYTEDDETPIATYPVLRQSFDTGEQDIWHLLQEIELSLDLMRKGDVWARPVEDYIEVVRLRRDSEGRPVAMEIRAEHFRDYLAARGAALLLGAFVLREANEAKLEGISWDEKRVTREFENGLWEGSMYETNTGGPQGITLRMWRESVDPDDDVPVMPHPSQEPSPRSEKTEFGGGGEVLEFAEGRIYWTEWIEPAELSPRIRRDEVEAQVHFIVGNQGEPKLSGSKLHDYRGWLWFRNSVIRELLNRERSFFKWWTHDTGSIGPSCITHLHFGLNELGHVNVAAYKMAELPEWAQKIWVAHNIPPEGGLSYELHQSQNLAAPARTGPPEMLIVRAIKLVQVAAVRAFGQELFHNLPDPDVMLRRIHRFQGASFEDTCHLAKEISRHVVEKLDQSTIDKLLSPENLKAANGNRLRSLKRLALLLDQLGHDGRALTKPLAGINDLRQGDAHTGSSSLAQSLELVGVSPDSQDHISNNVCMIRSVGFGLRDIAFAIDPERNQMKASGS